MALDGGNLERYARQQPWPSGKLRFRPPTEREFNYFDANGFEFVGLRPLILDQVVLSDPNSFAQGTLRHVYSAAGPDLTERPAPPIVVGINSKFWVGSGDPTRPENRESLVRIIEQ